MPTISFAGQLLGGVLGTYTVWRVLKAKKTVSGVYKGRCRVTGDVTESGQEKQCTRVERKHPRGFGAKRRVVFFCFVLFLQEDETRKVSSGVII